MKLTTKIKNIIFLYQAKEDISFIKDNYYADRFITHNMTLARKYYKNKNSLIRNLLATVFRLVRKKFPHKIGEFKDSEKMYKEYFTLERHIPSFAKLKKLVKTQEVWTTGFRNEFPVKGKRWCEYWINSSGINIGRAMKLGKYNRKYKWFYFEPFENSLNCTISEENFTQFKFSSVEEISAEKERIKKEEEFELKIEAKRKELQELYNKKGEL